ncbi:MAG: hypothetical protein WCJ30_05720 [Deltaproteobacteria bacterium]
MDEAEAFIRQRIEKQFLASQAHGHDVIRERLFRIVEFADGLFAFHLGSGYDSWPDTPVCVFYAKETDRGLTYFGDQQLCRACSGVPIPGSAACEQCKGIGWIHGHGEDVTSAGKPQSTREF